MLHRGRKHRYDFIPPAGEGPSSSRKQAKNVPVQEMTAPEHLSPPMRRWWKVVLAEHDLDAHRCYLLQAAAESWDRAQQAREQVAKEGTTFTDKNGNLRAHPAIATERDARALFARLVRQLALDPPPTPDHHHSSGIGWVPPSLK